MGSPASPAESRGCAQWWQNLARLLTRAMQLGQMVSRSRSCKVKSAPQKRHAASPCSRGALQAEQRTTAASCGRSGGVSSVVPQTQWKREPTSSLPASYCRSQLGHDTNRRITRGWSNRAAASIGNFAVHPPAIGSGGGVSFAPPRFISRGTSRLKQRPWLVRTEERQQVMKHSRDSPGESSDRGVRDYGQEPRNTTA